MLLIHALFKPTWLLLKATPGIESIKASVRRALRSATCNEKSAPPQGPCDYDVSCGVCDKNQAYHKQTRDYARKLQREAPDCFSQLLAVVVFGVVVPPLFLLAPLNSWFNWCALHWIARKEVHELYSYISPASPLHLPYISL